MSVVIDSREASKQKYIVRSLSKALDNIEIAPLPVGDYLICKTLLVERKTVQDFVGSLRTGRIRQQLTQLKELENLDKCILIEGWLGLVEKYSRFNISAVARFIDTIIFNYKIPVIQLPNKHWTVSWLIAKAKSLQEPKHRTLPLVMRRKNTPEQAILAILQSFPSISSERSRVIISSGLYKNLCDFINHPERLQQIKGIGGKTMERVSSIISYPWTNIN